MWHEPSFTREKERERERGNNVKELTVWYLYCIKSYWVWHLDGWCQKSAPSSKLWAGASYITELPQGPFWTRNSVIGEQNKLKPWNGWEKFEGNKPDILLQILGLLPPKNSSKGVLNFNFKFWWFKLID